MLRVASTNIERQSVLGEKNGQVKRTIVVLLLSTIYNNVLDNDKDNDKKKEVATAIIYLYSLRTCR